MPEINRKLRPLHPFGPNIPPCGNPKCKYCERLKTMDEDEFMGIEDFGTMSVVDLTTRRMQELRRAVGIMSARIRMQATRIDTLNDLVTRLRTENQRLKMAPALCENDEDGKTKNPENKGLPPSP